jgi:hypothetical protein
MKYIRARGGSQLWRSTARISALRDVDYGDMLDLVRADIGPIGCFFEGRYWADVGLPLR